MTKIPHRLQPFVFFVTQFFCYSLIILNTCAYTKHNYPITIISDGVFGIYGFYIIKAVGDATNKYSVIGYMLGGMVGSAFGIYISKAILG